MAASEHFKPEDTRRRSLAKALTWRVVAALITSCVAWIVSGKLALAVTIGAFDTVIKLGAYYFHERAWNRSHLFRAKPPEYQI